MNTWSLSDCGFYNKTIDFIIGMNVLDLVLTYIGLKNDYLIEENVLLRNLYYENEILFVLFKVAAIVLFSFCLKRFFNNNTNRIIRILLLLTLVVYIIVSMLHVYILLNVFIK